MATYRVKVGQLRSIVRGILKEESVKGSLREQDTPETQSVGDLKSKTIYELAKMIRGDWKSIYFGAKPYLSSMMGMDSIDDNDGYDSGRSVVNYFLANASTWRGPVAKAVKAELNRRVKSR